MKNNPAQTFPTKEKKRSTHLWWQASLLLLPLLFMPWLACSTTTPTEPIQEAKTETITEPSSTELTQEITSNESTDASESMAPEGAAPETTPETFEESSPEKPSVPKFDVKKIGAFIAGAHGLAIDSQNNIYMADSYGRQSPSKALYQLAPPYTGAPKALPISGRTPAGLQWHKQQLYVCDVGAGTVRVYDASFKLQRTLQVPSPWNISFAASGDAYVVSFNRSVYQLQMNGTARLLFGGLQNPFDIAPAPNNSFWVSEQGPQQGQAGRITLRSSDGTLQQQLTYSWRNPEGILFDNNGGLWIAETERGELLYYPKGGTTVQVIAKSLPLPVNLALFPNGDVLVGAVGSRTVGPTLYRVTQKKE